MLLSGIPKYGKKDMEKEKHFFPFQEVTITKALVVVYLK